MIICIVFFIIFSVFIYFLIKKSLNNSVSKSEERYISETGENSVQVDIITKNSNHYYLVRYTKSVKRYRSARSGSSAYNIYYKSSQCSGIYPLIIIANKKL